MVLASAFKARLHFNMKSNDLKTSQQNTIEEANKATVRRLYEECLNQGRFEVANEAISEAFVQPGPEGGRGPEGFKTNALRLRSGFPDVQFSIHELIAEGGKVALYWSWEATHRGVFANIPATGKRVRQEGMVMYYFETGKVVNMKVIFDRLGIFQQLEVSPTFPIARTSAQTVAT